MDFQAQAQTLVRDILAYTLAGRIDEEARITFADWITDAIETAVEAKTIELSQAIAGTGRGKVEERRALILCAGEGDDHPLGCLIVPGALSGDRAFFDTLDRLATQHGHTLLDRSVDDADSPSAAEDWLRRMNGGR